MDLKNTNMDPYQDNSITSDVIKELPDVHPNYGSKHLADAKIKTNASTVISDRFFLKHLLC
jgi:hypothetical protein